MEVDRDDLLGLESEGEGVRWRRVAGDLPEHRVGNFLELDHGLRHLAFEPLARGQEERDTLPSPVVDEHLHAGVGGRQRVVGHPGLVPVARHVTAVDLTLPVLAEGDGVVHVLTDRERPQASEQLDSFVTNPLGLPPGGRLDGGDPQQLHHVVLEHVAEHASLLVVAGTLLDTESLGGDDPDVVHVVAVPQRLEDGVRQTEREHVLHRLLGKVVVDTKELVLLEVGEQTPVEALGGA